MSIEPLNLKGLSADVDCPEELPLVCPFAPPPTLWKELMRLSAGAEPRGGEWYDRAGEGAPARERRVFKVPIMESMAPWTLLGWKELLGGVGGCPTTG
jgi:hypothetical protein